MGKLLATIGAIAGSALGWWLGARVGIMTATLVSAVGTGVGLYGGRWIASHYFD